MKERELENINERIDRLRFILDELKNDEITVEEPFLPLTDNPERIMTVDPSEVIVILGVLKVV